MATQSFALSEIQAFVRDVRALGIEPQQVFLFGSYARNEQHADSDIDVAIVSADFCGFRPEDSGRMSPARSKHVEIELHSFRPEDFTDWNPFVEEIKRTGIRVV